MTELYKNHSFTISHADDMELIEITSPADFTTINVENP